MALKLTRWSPDTCGCVVVYQWDSVVPQESRVHAFHHVERVCPSHATLTGAAAYQSCVEENRTKNLVFGWLLENVPRIRQMTRDERGEETGLDLIPTVEFVWAFSGEGAARVLRVSLMGETLSSGELNGLAAFTATLEKPVQMI